jgi:hypothetical protein
MDRTELLRRASAAVAIARKKRESGAKISAKHASDATKFDLVANIVHENPPDTVAGTGTAVGSAAGPAAAALIESVAALSAKASALDQKSGGSGLSAASSQAAKAVRLSAASSDPILRGNYKVQVVHDLEAAGEGGGALTKWYELADLTVTEVLPQLIALSESYVLVYKRRGAESSSSTGGNSSSDGSR